MDRKVADGTVLSDQFEIIEFLGAGNFGEVYRAKQLVFGYPLREVALKLFKADLIKVSNVYEVFADAVTLISLQEEQPDTEVAKRLVRVYDLGFIEEPAAGKRAFISMELIPGKKTLTYPIRQFSHEDGGMPVETSLRYLQEMLIPLAWMHSLDRCAVHGDLKPENILVTESSNLVITDFGLASRLPLGSFGGTISYQSPETLSGLPGQATSDVYAIGIIWYEMLTGRHPFKNVGLEATAADDNKALSRAHQMARKWEIRSLQPGEEEIHESRIPPASEFNREFKRYPVLEEMLNRCLAYKESERYANALLLKKDLESYLKTGDAPTTFVDYGLPEEQDEEDDSVLPEKDLAALISDAQVLLGQGEAEAALKVVNEIFQSYPNELNAMKLKARVLARLGQIEEAKSICTEAQKLAPRDPDVLNVMADVADAAGNGSMAQSLRMQASKRREQNRN